MTAMCRTEVPPPSFEYGADAPPVSSGGLMSTRTLEPLSYHPARSPHPACSDSWRRASSVRSTCWSTSPTMRFPPCLFPRSTEVFASSPRASGLGRKAPGPSRKQLSSCLTQRGSLRWVRHRPHSESGGSRRIERFKLRSTVRPTRSALPVRIFSRRSVSTLRAT